MKRWICLGLVAVAVSVAGSTLRRGPYVQMAAPDGIRIVWRSTGPMVPSVRFGEAADRLDEVGEMVSERRGEGFLSWHRSPDRLSGASSRVYQYEAKLSGLKPDARYYYAVYDGPTRVAGGGEGCSFRTAPAIGVSTPARFWVLGDSGTGGDDQARVYAAMTNYWRREGREPDFVLHVGDIAYPRGTDRQFQRHFFEVYQPTLGRVVCWPAIGNHECYSSRGTNGTGEGPYFDAYTLPSHGESGGLASGTESYYSFDWGRVHLLSLNTSDEDLSATGRMANWARADLAGTAARGKSDWIVAFFHHAPYSKGSHDSEREKDLGEVRRNLVPILEAGGVDLVLCGHSHTYERSLLLDGAYDSLVTPYGKVLDDGDGDPLGDGPYRKSVGIRPQAGTVYVVTGNGGASLGRKGTMPVVRRVFEGFGSTLVDVAGDTLAAVMVGAEGELLDRFALVKRGRVEPARVADPWQPSVWSRFAGLVDSPSADVPDRYVARIERGSEWHYWLGNPPGFNWTSVRYDDHEWPRGKAALGVGYPQCQTVLDPIRNQPQTLYARREFSVASVASIGELGLWIDFDAGFIAYLNGTEVARVNVPKGSGSAARNVRAHPARGYRYYPLDRAERYLRQGTNVLAVETHPAQKRGGGCLLDPALLETGPAEGR